MFKLSSAIVLYLAPLLMFTTIILELLVLFAPTVLLHSQVALMFISASSTAPEASKGAFLALGPLGSCGRGNPSAKLACTNSSFAAIYDTSVLPRNINAEVIAPLPSGAPAFVVVGLAFSILFFLSYVLVAVSTRLTKLQPILRKAHADKIASVLGWGAFLIVTGAFLIMRLWFGKMVDDFNRMATRQGSSIGLVASLGNGFTMIWVAIAFSAVPLLCCMIRSPLKEKGKA